MSVVTFRVPDAIRKRMAKVKINWSEYIRHAISDALESNTKSILLRKVLTLRSQTGASRGTSTRIIRAIRDRA